MWSVGAAVVVNHQLVILRIFGRRGIWWSTWKIGIRMRFLIGRIGGFFRVLETSDEEFAGACNVNVHVAVHSMFRQEVDTKFFASFCEAEEAVESQDVGEDSSSLIVMYHFEELEGCLFRSRFDDASFCGIAKIVDARVLMVKSTVQNSSSDSSF